MDRRDYLGREMWRYSLVSWSFWREDGLFGSGCLELGMWIVRMVWTCI